MSKRFQMMSLGLALTAILGLSALSGRGVFAQDATSTPTTGTANGASTPSADTDDDAGAPEANKGNGFRGDHGNRGGNMGPGNMGPGKMDGGPMAGGRGGMFGHSVDKEALATFLGITTDELSTELRAGSSLAQVAENRGKTRDDLKAFLVSQYEAGLDDMIDATFGKPSDTNTNTDDSTATPATDATPAAMTGFTA